MIKDLLIYSLLGTVLVVFLYSVWISFSKKTNSQTEAEETKKKFHIRILKEVFDSAGYYTALSQVLPRGKDDEKYGFDYIPFMLEILVKKAERSRKSANFFLRATISLTLFFIIVSLVFGYVLMIDSSIGIYREIEDLNQIANSIVMTDSIAKVSDVEERFRILNRYDIFEEMKSFSENREKQKDNILNFLNDNNSNRVKFTFHEIDIIEEKFLETNNLNDVKSSLHRILDRDKDDLETRKFLAKIDKGIQLYYKNITLDNETINSSKKAILNIVEKINNKFEAEKSQLSELIKRSIIGVLLISFFVAILRYFRNLYQFHLNEMLKDESKEIEIRKFYIAMKCAESNPEERKLVLSNFINETKLSVETSQPSSTQQPEMDMLKDILNSLLKKI
ncbi:hypothetical protein [Flectobacillus roseus]|uniref:Uncharacterized protein n=1 Tax=Flectobacillus roseus TaxID=502259 RepID=A0ABT6Y4I0_9BACT|nr:hypothetical protein [Flectobacillus roseus]MDI9858369.1 hypothetical protein [Flectobacillus roseus]